MDKIKSVCQNIENIEPQMLTKLDMDGYIPVSDYRTIFLNV